MSQTVIFAGPTISAESIHSILPEAMVLAPPVQGQVLAALGRYWPHTIGLIDAGFPRSAWVSEFLHALQSGVTVHGAGGQGALRAVELSHYGMKGHGKIFRMVQEQQLPDDHLLCHYSNNGSYSKMSQPYVVIQETLRAAYGQGLLDRRQFDDLCRIALHLHWKKRNWKQILDTYQDQAATNQEHVDRWGTWLQQNQVDLPGKDAMEMLKFIAAEQTSRQKPAPQRYEPVPLSATTAHLQVRERGVIRDDVEVPPFSIAHHAAINHPRPLQQNFHGMNRELVVFFAKRMELDVSESDIEFERCVIIREHSLQADQLDSWRLDNDLTKEDFEEFLHKNALCRKMHLWLTMKNGFAKSTGAILDQLRIAGEYSHYAADSAAIEAVKRHAPEQFQKEFNRHSFEELLAIKENKSPDKRLPWVEPYQESANFLGISKQELNYELKRENFAHRKNIGNLLNSLWDDEE